MTSPPASAAAFGPGSPPAAANGRPGPARVAAVRLDVGYAPGSPVLGGLELDASPGEVLAVVGPNGAGKTTLFRTLLGILPPLAGEATISGMAPAAYRTAFGVGYLAEDTAMPSGWTCDGILALAASAVGPGADPAWACELAGVDYPTTRLAEKLSKGMRRRLGLAVALVGRPGLLFLDEPEAGLDPGQRMRLRGKIKEVARGTTVLVASHDLGELAVMSDRVLLIGDGGARLVEPPPGGFTREFLEETFLGSPGSLGAKDDPS